MRSIRFALAVCVLFAAQPAGAVLYPYEGASGTATAGGVGNNAVDVSAPGSCAATVAGTVVTVVGCRNRTGTFCAPGVQCDLLRVPAGRCSYTDALNVTCLWPNGAGFCTADGNVGCTVDSHCTSLGLGGTCDLSSCPGGDCSGCACQGSDPTLFDFESGICGNAGGICSDGDGEFPFPPVLGGGLSTFITGDANAGRGAGQSFTGPRSGYENPAPLITAQRKPGLGSLASSTANPTAILDYKSTAAYDIGPIEDGTLGTTNRGGIRSVKLLGDSFWADVAYSDGTISGSGVNATGPTTYYYFAPGPSIPGNPGGWWQNNTVQGICRGVCQSPVISACVVPTDCPGAGQSCVANVCECSADAQCLTGQDCTAGRCSVVQAARCTTAATCAAPATDVCVQSTSNTGAICIDEATCNVGNTVLGQNCHRTLFGHQTAINTVGYIWTQNIDPNDPLLSPPTLDVDGDGQKDCPPTCGVDYDLDTLEQMVIEAALLIDQEAGVQLMFDFLSGRAAGAGDSIGAVSIESDTWADATFDDMRCFLGGDPAAVCSACVGSVCGTTTLACTTDRDCQLYIGRCAAANGAGSQSCDPGATGGLTPCPGGQTCHSCFGPYGAGACTAGTVGGSGVGGTCRVDGDCPLGACGSDPDGAGTLAGLPLYPEVPGPVLIGATPGPNTAPGPNPKALPPGYNTYGFTDLELDTKCNAAGPGDDVNGRIGNVSPTTASFIANIFAPPRIVAVPLAFIATTGKAASQVVDLDTVPPFDNAFFGLSAGGLIGISEPIARRGRAAGDPLSGGTFAAGRVFPVDPTGAACCNGGATILTTKNVTFGNARANLAAVGAGPLSWGSLTQGTATTTFMRASAWSPGLTNRAPGCMGDTIETTGQSAFPDAGPCNDPLGLGVSAECTGSNCTNQNTGADDRRQTAVIDNACVPVFPARAKVGSPASQTPTLYTVGGLTGIDIDLFTFTEIIDFSATVETYTCPLRGACVGDTGVSCALNSDCAVVGGPCANRTRTCENIFGACASAGDLDGDGVCNDVDTCETIPNTGIDSDGDLVDNACDTCTNLANPQLTGSPGTDRTWTSRQPDDDGNMTGNRCDFKYIDDDGLTIVTVADVNRAKAALGKNLSLLTCNAASCGEFDHNQDGLSIVSVAEVNLAKGNLGKSTNPTLNTTVATCANCSLDPDGVGPQPAGASNVLGSGGERVGRPVCQGLNCAYQYPTCGTAGL